MARASSRADDLDRLTVRVAALGEAADLCEGRVPRDVLAQARRVSQQVDRRLAFSGGATVVALAGATGSGKSSLFNAMAGSPLAPAGVRRPTTSVPMAATWGREPSGELLDWLGVPTRHGVSGGGLGELNGLVLLDLPDHDSTEQAHRLEVDRLVQLVDVLIWVVDPQKYADAALHERYLQPLAQHAEVMLVVLNQIDRLSADQADACRRDLRRLLDDEGLQRVDVVATSAETGAGLDELRQRLARQVSDKQAAARRLSADVAAAATALEQACGGAAAPGVSAVAVRRMNLAIADAAGVGLVTDAVRRAWLLRGGLATGWPVLSWVARFKPDPLRRLRVGLLAGRRGRAPQELESAEGEPPVSRTSLPATTGVQRSRVESAVRELADEAGQGLSRGWTDALKQAARSHGEGLPDALDRAIGATDLDLDRHRRWWQLVRVLQWLLVATMLAGLVWLGVAFVLLYLQLPPLPSITWWGLPVPTVLIGGGVVAGLLVAGLSRIGVGIGARRREIAARRALRGSIGRITDAQVLQPVRTELQRYEHARVALNRATGRA